MSDLLSGLRKAGDHRDPDEFNPVLCVDWYNEALDDVAEALRNPTDEQVDAVAAAEYALRIPNAPRGYHRQPKWYKKMRRAEARRWMTALTGGTDE